MTEIDLKALQAPFPAQEIEWRVGSTTADKKSGLALAYLTARHVMDRLDDVCGPARWQDRYEFHGARTVCYLSILIGDEWVTKADGAGDSDVEAEKGAISDALKRAAVKWGIGRYLYLLGNTWVTIEPVGKSYKIAASEYAKLERQLVAKFGGEYAPPAPAPKADGVIAAVKEARETPPPDSEHAIDKDFLDATAGPKPRLTEDVSGRLYVRLQDQLKAAAKVSLTALGEEWKANQPDIKRLPEKQEMELRDLKDSLKSVFLVNTP
jgi:hypothetical protein